MINYRTKKKIKLIPALKQSSLNVVSGLAVGLWVSPVKNNISASFKASCFIGL